MKPKILYHYTSYLHVPAIIDSGFLKLTESNASFKIENAAPQVVWLTQESYTRKLSTPKMLGIHKSNFRFVIERPDDAQRADKWLKKNGASEFTMDILERSGGAKLSTMYVVPRIIPSDEWVRLEGRLSTYGFDNPNARYDGKEVTYA